MSVGPPRVNRRGNAGLSGREERVGLGPVDAHGKLGIRLELARVVARDPIPGANARVVALVVRGIVYAPLANQRLLVTPLLKLERVPPFEVVHAPVAPAIFHPHQHESAPLVIADAERRNLRRLGEDRHEELVEARVVGRVE